MVRIKICGITNIDDAIAAVEAGADALGFVFAESPRKIDPKAAFEIVQALPPFVTTVGVFANQEAEEITWTMKRACLQIAQVHGDLLCGNSEESGGIGCRRLIRAIGIRSEDDVRQAVESARDCNCTAFLLDAHAEGKMGGTGQTFDWNLAVLARAMLGKPMILAGGLTPENVGEAVDTVQPYAIDVSSGVECEPGKKDHDKIREFIENARYIE